MNIHVSLVPYIKAAGELKQKPTQHSVQELRRIGITPHMLVCRTEKELPKALKDKLALFRILIEMQLLRLVMLNLFIKCHYIL